jgi:predicted TIM-barrel fold metal-dependent hydrolase
VTTSTRKRVEMLPDPEPREVKYTLISVDDHLVEPPEMFEGRLPKKYQESAPRIVRQDDGSEQWLFDGGLIPMEGSNAVVGQADRSDILGPQAFEDMRKGSWDVHERIRDMDRGGIWASLNFPSIVSGFCGRIFSNASDPELGLWTTRAWNDWMLEGWCGAYPDRLIPQGITWLADPQLGAAEIRRNAERGFKAVSLPDRPHKIGLPSLHSGYWDPILQACDETDTVICLHVGSTGLVVVPEDAPPGSTTVLFPALSLEAFVDWVWSGVAVKFPNLKIVMAEGGIGWVPMVYDRLEYLFDHAGGHSYGIWGWNSRGYKVDPIEIAQRNFYYCVLDDPSTIMCRDRIGIDKMLAEVDYPHADSTWPDSQTHFEKLLAGLSVEEIRQVTHLNAAKLFRHPLPPVTVP